MELLNKLPRQMPEWFLSPFGLARIIFRLIKYITFSLVLYRDPMIPLQIRDNINS